MGDTSLTKVILTSVDDISGLENGTKLLIATDQNTGAETYITIEYER